MSKNKNMNASKKQFAIYIIAAFTIAYAFQIIASLFFNPAFSKYTVIGPTPIGIVAMIPMIAYMVYICIKERKKSEITT